LIQSVITKGLDDGILKIPPPILSRVYQTLSRGFVNLLNAKKIADTRFPFPYAQLITILLFMHLIFMPLFMSALVPSRIWAPFLTFVPLFVMFSINFVGVELENPFGTDANDLPLDHFQGEMNKCLMMLLHESADLIADVSETRCVMDYNDLVATMKEGLQHNSEALSRKDSLTAFVADMSEDYMSTVNSMTSRMSNVVGLGDNSKRKSSKPTPISAQISKLEASSSSSLDLSKIAAEIIGTPAPAAEPDIQASSIVLQPPPSPKGPEVMKEAKMDSKSATAASLITLSTFSSELPLLKELVETQVRELNLSVLALKDFSNSLPRVVDYMLLNNCGVHDQSRLSTDTRRGELASNSPSLELL